MNSKRTFQWQASVESAQQLQHAAAHGAKRPAKATAATQPRPAAIPGSGQKSVLLVDSNRRSREARAKVMRTMGVRVECAGNAGTARVRLANEKYNLILVDLGEDVAAAESFVTEIRTRDSRQLVGFLVGSPLFVAQSLDGKSGTPISIGRPATAQTAPEPEPPGSDSNQKTRIGETEQEQVAS
jgi:CheY-like chemotaxis protein